MPIFALTIDSHRCISRLLFHPVDESTHQSNSQPSGGSYGKDFSEDANMKSPRDLYALGGLDTQLPFLYIRPRPKRVLINSIQSISMAVSISGLTAAAGDG